MKKFFLFVFLCGVVVTLPLYAQIQEVGGNKHIASSCKDAEFDKKTKNDIIDLLKNFYDKKTLFLKRLQSKEITPTREQKIAEEITRLMYEKDIAKFPISWHLLLSLSEQPVILMAYPQKSIEKIEDYLNKVQMFMNRDWTLGDCEILHEFGLIPKTRVSDKIEISTKDALLKKIIELKKSLLKK